MNIQILPRPYNLGLRISDFYNFGLRIADCGFGKRGSRGLGAMADVTNDAEWRDIDTLNQCAAIRNPKSDIPFAISEALHIVEVDGIPFDRGSWNHRRSAHRCAGRDQWNHRLVVLSAF